MSPRRRKPPTPSPQPTAITPELLSRLETLAEPGDRAGELRTRIQPAHRRLKASGKIEPEAESAVQTLCDQILLAETGYRDPGSASDGGNIVTAQMLASDVVRRFEACYGAGAAILIALACIECRRAAWVAHDALGFRAPANPAAPTESWYAEGRIALDAVLVPLFRAMGEEIKPKNGSCMNTAKRVKTPSSPELGVSPESNV